MVQLQYVHSSETYKQSVEAGPRVNSLSFTHNMSELSTTEQTGRMPVGFVLALSFFHIVPNTGPSSEKEYDEGIQEACVREALSLTERATKKYAQTLVVLGAHAIYARKPPAYDALMAKVVQCLREEAVPVIRATTLWKETQTSVQKSLGFMAGPMARTLTINYITLLLRFLNLALWDKQMLRT